MRRPRSIHRDGPIAPALRELTGGRGVDLVYDPVGGSLAEDAAGALARNGRLLSVGFASGEWPSLSTVQLVMTNTSLVGVFAGGYSREELEDIHAGLAGLVADGRLRNAVTAKIPFDELAGGRPVHGRPRRGRQARDGAGDPMTKAPDFDLDAEEIVTAAVEIFEESGLDAVSMRSVSARLGVSPVPLYSRIGNKEALVDAIADRLLVDLAPPSAAGEPWDRYAVRWARELRTRLRKARDSRLILSAGREAYVEASRPLVEAMRADGMSADAAVQACRLLMWATVGFGAVESGVEPPRQGPTPDPPGWRPRGRRRRREPTRCSTPHSLHRRRHHERTRAEAGLGPRHDGRTVDR